MTYRFVFALCVVLFAGTAFAADNDGNYAVWGQGKKSCFHYSQARKEPDSATMEGFRGFVLGYLTAYNTITPKTYNIAGKMELGDVLAWLDDYCEQKGMHSFDQAVLEFTVQHYEQRTTFPPGRFRR